MRYAHKNKKEYSALNGLISLGLAEEPHEFREWKPQRIWAQARKRVLGLARTRLPAVLLIGFSLVKKSCLARVGRTEEDSSTCRDRIEAFVETREVPVLQPNFGSNVQSCGTQFQTFPSAFCGTHFFKNKNYIFIDLFLN